VRRFLARFAAQQLEVALEAMSGWRFLVEELRAVGGVVQRAEPAETAALRGSEKRAKSDRADARHHRGLLLAGRLPESWIPPDHILDLRARVRLRHTLIEQHREWRQRIQAVLFHHGCLQRRGLMTGDGREWLRSRSLPETGGEQITVAVAMIDALERQLAPLTRELRGYARRQTGCQALIEAYYGVGELCAVTVVAELGDCRFHHRHPACRKIGSGRLPGRGVLDLTRCGRAAEPLGDLCNRHTLRLSVVPRECDGASALCDAVERWIRGGSHARRRYRRDLTVPRARFRKSEVRRRFLSRLGQAAMWPQRGLVSADPVLEL
jgi:hypothetical protein